LDISKSGDEDDNGLRIAFKDLLQPMKALFTAGNILAEIHVQQDHIIGIVVQQERDLVGVLFNDDMMDLLLQQQFRSKKHVLIIVNHKDLTAFSGHSFQV